jgi:thiamine biosynthesis lipoprotein
VGVATIEIDVMGTVARFTADTDDDDRDDHRAATIAADAALLMWELERCWSRFDPGSEISELNRAAGRAIEVSLPTLLLVRLACAGAVITDGLFDATVLGAVERAGYDRSFTTMSANSIAHATSGFERGSPGIVVDDDARTVRLPRGVGIDPGGIGKGLAADLAVDAMLAAGATGAQVEIGGDARVVVPDGPCAITVAHPDDGSILSTVALRDGAIATSSPRLRRWTRDGECAHHLIDPRTGAPTDNEIVCASVVAAHGWQAEVLAKAVCIAGTDALALVDDLGAAALVATTDDVVVTTTGWPAALTTAH